MAEDEERVEACADFLLDWEHSDEQGGVYDPKAYYQGAQAQGYTDEEIREADPAVWEARHNTALHAGDNYPDHRTLGDN
jgi:hypothetical protein